MRVEASPQTFWEVTRFGPCEIARWASLHSEARLSQSARSADHQRFLEMKEFLAVATRVYAALAANLYILASIAKASISKILISKLDPQERKGRCLGSPGLQGTCKLATKTGLAGR